MNRLTMEGGAEAAEPPTRTGCCGYPVRTSSAACIAAVDEFRRHVFSYGRGASAILRAPREDPSSVLANSLAAHFAAAVDPSAAASFLSAAAGTLDKATDYERAVYSAVSCLVGDDRDEFAALDRHFELLKEFPRDLLSLKRAQVLCFYLGRPDLSLNLVEQVVVHNEDENYIYGMLAFPLLELGRMAEAEKAALKALDINKDDCWAQHALCHVYQQDCHFQKAVDFMESCSSSWSVCSSFMYTHNWWHVAVCYLEGNYPLEKVLEVYDRCIWKELQASDAVPSEVYLNALGLLLRIYVRGQMSCIQERLLILARRLKDKSVWHVEWLLDLLALWALACSQEMQTATDLLHSMKSRISLITKKRQQLMRRAIQLGEAIYEYASGTYQRSFDILGPEFDAVDYKVIGASDEQLDVFNEVWYDILLNTGHFTKAIEVIEKQINKRERAPFLWRMLERAYSMQGKQEQASAAAGKAESLEAA